VTLFARAAQGFRIPTFYDLHVVSPLGVELRAVAPERVVVDAEGGLRMLEGGVVIQAAAFTRLTRNAIVWLPGSFTWSPRNVEREQVHGAEARGSAASGALRGELWAGAYVTRARIDGQETWCDRRLLSRIHRYTLDRLRREIEPVTAAQFLRFLACWQHVDPQHRADGPGGVAEVVAQLAGFEAPAAAWEANILPARVRGYKREWLDQLTLGGEVAWARFWGAAQSSIRRTPIALVPRAQLEAWTALAAATPRPDPGPTAREVLDVLQARGAVFVQEIARATRLPPASVEEGLGALVAAGRVTCDSFGGLRWLLVPSGRRRSAGLSSGRWSLVGSDVPVEIPRVGFPSPPWGLPVAQDEHAEMVARVLLRRTGVVFRRTITRERIPVPWRVIARACRTLEARGEIRGGRFVAGFDGEQYALPEAVTMLREVRRRGDRPLGSTPLSVAASDPLNFQGILTPAERVPASAGYEVAVG